MMMTRAVFAAALATTALTLASCAPAGSCPPARGGPAPGAAYAVVLSDYTSSALALLDADGVPLDDAYLDSGSAAPGLAAALSGDVTLPTGPPPAGRLLWLDRFGVDLVGRVDLSTGALEQLATAPEAVGGEAGFRSNPHDAVALPDDTLWVSRHEKNLAPDARELDRGDDLVWLSPGGREPVGRVSLEGLDVRVDTADGPVMAFARPDRLITRGGVILAGLARLSADFRVAGPGAVAVVDPASGELWATELDGLTSCGELAADPDDVERAFVVCAGATFGDQDSRRADAGVVALRVSGAGPATVEWMWRASDHPELPPPTSAPVAHAGGRLWVVSMGDARGPGDRLLHLDLEGGVGEVVYEAQAAFTLGPGALTAGGELWLPDAGRGVLRLAPAGDGTLRPLGVIEVGGCRALPVRELRRLR